MPFRDSILAISPPFLLGDESDEIGVATAIQYAEGAAMGAVNDWMMLGVKASMPGYGPPDALSYVGRDMLIDRGPTETDDHYAARLQGAVDSHRVQGSAPELLRQLEAWFSPSGAPIRLVSNRAVWHEIDPSTLVVTRTNVGTNWYWDGYQPTRWWRGWVIIDASGGPWTQKTWGDGGLWGDGGTWGSSATQGQIAQIRSWIDKWKPANIVVPYIIVVFDGTTFARTNTAPPNPSSSDDTSRASWRMQFNAIFWPGV